MTLLTVADVLAKPQYRVGAGGFVGRLSGDFLVMPGLGLGSVRVDEEQCEGGSRDKGEEVWVVEGVEIVESVVR